MQIILKDDLISSVGIISKLLNSADNNVGNTGLFIKAMDNHSRITSDFLRKRLQHGENLLLIDLRLASEFQGEHIEGSINLPMEEFNPEDLLKNHPGKTVYLVCSTGKRAYQAAEALYKHDFRDVCILAGGILAWRVLGYPLAGKRR